MKDFLDNELNIEDEVVYIYHARTSSELKKGKIIDITNKMVKIETSAEYNGVTYKQPDKIIDIYALKRKIKNEL